MLVTDAVALNDALVEAEEADAKRRMTELQSLAEYAAKLVDIQTKTIRMSMGQLAAGMVRRG
jgi:hypothetical protein